MGKTKERKGESARRARGFACTSSILGISGKNKGDARGKRGRRG